MKAMGRTKARSRKRMKRIKTKGGERKMRKRYCTPVIL